MNLSVVILAAGLGKRMHSDMPKILHPLAGKPLIHHVVETVLTLNPKGLHLVYGHQGDRVRQALTEASINWVEQMPQLGTGHAVAQAMPYISDETSVLVLCGDVPLIKATTLQNLCAQTPWNGIGLLTIHLEEPYGYGRIVRDVQGHVEGIVEEKDADVQTKQIKEVNTGILLMPALSLRRWLGMLNNHNAQGEYYLTEIVRLAVKENIPIHTVRCHDVYEVMGVNDRQQLAVLDRYYQSQQIHHLMLAGVTVMDPSRLDIRGHVQTGRDVSIDVNVILEGNVVLGNHVKIGPHTILRHAHLADHVEVLSHCVIEGVKIGEGCKIGPFARLRPETVLAEHVHIGNFVEVKKSTIDQSSKINHLSYIGDSEVGKEVNIGAGTITCNYDGANKHKTIIEDRAFIGSDTQLVAPVTVKEGATIGAGSTITQEAPANTLTLSRVRQVTIEDWQRPSKK